jgi:hypothetical protein
MLKANTNHIALKNVLKCLLGIRVLFVDFRSGWHGGKPSGIAD